MNQGKEDHQIFFDHHAEVWHDRIQQEDLIRLNSILRGLSEQIKSPVLDIGCGTGINLPFLAGDQGLDDIVEVDLSHKMLKKNIEKHTNLHQAFYVQGNVQMLPFKPESFKSIISFASFAHFPQKEKVLIHFNDILRPFGTLAILHLFGHRELNKMHQRFGGAVKHDKLPPLRTLASLICSSGFTILRQEESQDLYLIVAKKTADSCV